MDAGMEQAAGDEGKDEAMTPERVFVVWDSTIDGMETVLAVLKDDPPPGFAVHVLGLEPGSDTVWAGNVEPGIAKAANILAIVNKPNANVGFEIGFALGKQKGMRLVAWTKKKAVPAWVDRPPFKTQLIPREYDVDALGARIAERKWVRLDGRPVKGDDTLLLCPHDGEASAIRKIVRKASGWRELDEHGWTLNDLPVQLNGVGRVVWIVMPFLDDDECEEERDGQENAAMAAVAGFAVASGIELRVWQNRRAREILDVGHVATPFDSKTDVEKLVAAIVSPKPAAASPPKPRDAAALLSDYRAHVRAVHSSLVPFFAGTSNKLLSEIFVELQIQSAWLERAAAGEHKSHWSLRELLHREGHRRFVVLGDPGAGKSTVCRHLAYELAGDETGNEPFPLFASLARLADARGDVFDLAEADLRGAKGEAAAKGLAEALRARATAKAGEGPAVWLLLDGLDEVPSAASARLVNERLPAMLDGLTNVAVVVTSRAIGYRPIGHRFESAKLLELEPEDGKHLLENWIGADAERVWGDLQAHPLLREMSRNPLMLTLIAKLALEGKPMPRTRIRLYEAVLDVLLRRGAGLEPKGIEDPETTIDLLAPLSLQLHEAEGECWDKADIAKCVWTRCRADADYDFRLTKAFETPERFLKAIAEQTGILGPLHGENEPWRYLHRSLREYLAARALLSDDRAEYVTKAKANVQHWGETFALLTGMVPEAERLPMLESLREADDALALRALPHVEGIEPEALFGFLKKVKDWSGDYLANLVATWLEEGVGRGQAKEVLWKWISPERSTEELSYLDYAMERNGIDVEREPFFRACGRWLEEGWPEVEVVELPPDGKPATFEMGSPEGVGHGDERPRHLVTLSPFAIGVTTVTEAQYAAFDPTRESKKRADHPIVNVSWWDARLFTRWLPPRADRPAALPTEAQWEYACRAGSEAKWCFGDSEKDLKKYAWFGEGPSGRAHPVRKKRPNDFGLYDMHGNVWEWCADWKGDYAAEPAEDPAGPVSGSDRVCRGGSCWSDAGLARSAFRLGWRPGFRFHVVGFRVAFPAPRPRSR